MYDFYFYPLPQLILLFAAVLFLFVLQAAYVGALIFNNPMRRKYIITGELLLLVYFAILGLAPITVISNKRYGIIDFYILNLIFYIVGIFSVIYFIYMLAKKQKRYIVPIVAVLITMPFMSALPYGMYYICFVISIGCSVVRSYRLITREMYRQKHEISSFSVKEGLDTLPTGVMFCDSDGYIYLTNVKMQELTVRFFGKEQKNGKEFWQSIENGVAEGAECQVIEGDVLLRTPSDAWRFSKHYFADNKTEYIEITAIEVTKTVAALSELEQDREKLIIQNREIRELSAKMEVLRAEREYSRIRSQVHDVIGQKLTAMQRIIQSYDIAHPTDVVAILQDIVTQIKSKEGGDAAELFCEFQNYFKRIGMNVKLCGSLPKDKSVAFLFLAVLREASTNAARHAGATEVLAKIECSHDNYCMEITNNGWPPKEKITEGGGLSGIRSRIENVGGMFEIRLSPKFALVITVGRSGEDD